MPPTADLAELVETVRRCGASEEPLAVLEAAVELSGEVRDLADAVLHHYVQAARDAGCGWPEVAAALGPTRHRIQRQIRARFREERNRPPFTEIRGVLDRGVTRNVQARQPGRQPLTPFTKRANASIAVACDEARRLGHVRVGTPHLLLGVVHDRSSLAVEALRALRVSPEVVHDGVVGAVTPDRRPLRRQGHLSFSPRGRGALELALREALRAGQDYVGTGHVLLGLAVQRDGRACRVLSGLGVTADDLRRQVGRLS